MSESVCPKCGAKKYCRADDEGVYHSDPDCFWTVFECGTSLHDNGETLIEWPTCLRRQLAQRDERIRELEAEVERLTEENAHMRTMLKAASAIALMDDD